MGPIKDWIADPTVAAGFNLGRGAAASLGAFATPKNQTAQVGSIYSSTAPMFEAALRAQEQAGVDQMAAYESQAQLAELEAQQQAEQKAREVGAFREQQANVYNASGVLLEGSPMMVLDETVRLGQQEINAIRQRGQATSSMLRRQGAASASQNRASIFGARSQFNQAQLQAKAQASAEANKLQTSGFMNAFSQLFSHPSTSMSGVKGKAQAQSTKPPKPATQQIPLKGYLPQPGFKPPTT